MPVLPGFYLYHIVQQVTDYAPPLGDLEAFENEWCEVEVPWKLMKPSKQKNFEAKFKKLNRFF